MTNLAFEPVDATVGDDREIEEALKAAHIPSLILSLVHLTGDTSLMRESPRPLYEMFGDGQGGLPSAFQDKVRAKALDVLKAWRDTGKMPASPNQKTVREMMDFIAGADIPDRYVPFLLEELAIDGDEPRATAPRIDVPNPVKDRFHVLVIGAGMSGILSAIELQQAGVPFVVIEKNPDVGGTWLENSYPGCRVDNPSHLYSYSSEPNHNWPQFYSNRNVLYNYFRGVADKHALRSNIRFETTVEEAAYDQASRKWNVRVRTKGGNVETLRVNAVISAVGQLNQPKYPDIEGRDSFKGVSFHSARWNHDYDLTGKRVVVIGTGASAYQFVPEIAPKVAHMTVLQRSAPWAGPAPDYHHDVPAGMRWLLQHVPYYETWYRFYLFWMLTDGIYDAVKADPNWKGPEHSISQVNEELRQALASYIEAQCGDDEELKRKVVPTYPPGGKRMLRDNGTWVEALRRDNVDLVTTGLKRITPTGVELADGRHIEADVIIYGTGFYASDFLRTFKVKGKGGVELHDQWAGDARAYLGISIPKFPNLFVLYGPNTNIVVNGSIIFFSECALRYVLGCIKLLLEEGYSALDVKQDVHDRFNEKIDRLNEQMAWGVPQVSSWYKNAKGRVSQNWPLPLVDYWTATRAPNPADYTLEK